MLDALVKSGSGSEDQFDILIIGGGATGAGVAVDAVTRGLKVALVERDDFSSGARRKNKQTRSPQSDNSTRLDRDFFKINQACTWRRAVPPESRVRTRL